MPKLNSLGCYFDWALTKIGRSDSELLMQHVLGISTTEAYSHRSRQVDRIQGEHLCKLVEERACGMPLDYITGISHFWTIELEVNRSVLIPRPETEILVEECIEHVRDGDSVLDLGTGSGAIALALRSELDIHVVGTDSDEHALAVCRRNASKLNLNIEVLLSDWYSDVTGEFDLIASNPPYVRDCDPRLAESDIRFEPRTALLGGSDGLDALRRVIGGAMSHLKNGGHLVVEHGFDQQDATIELFEKAGFTKIRWRNDYAGTHRVVCGTRHE